METSEYIQNSGNYKMLTVYLSSLFCPPPTKVEQGTLCFLSKFSQLSHRVTDERMDMVGTAEQCKKPQLWRHFAGVWIPTLAPVIGTTCYQNTSEPWFIFWKIKKKAMCWVYGSGKLSFSLPQNIKDYNIINLCVQQHCITIKDRFFWTTVMTQIIFT